MSKYISFIVPIDWMRGSLSGSQSLKTAYNGGAAYSVSDGDIVSAADYVPKLIAKVAHCGTRRERRYFSVRTKTSVNMTAAMRSNLAVMGGAGALFASLISDKTTAIYKACVSACPKNTTLRAFVVPLLRSGLAAKATNIAIGDTYIINPWVSMDAPNVPVSSAVINKFAAVLANI